MTRKKYLEDDIHSENIQEIISTPPSWLLTRGISLTLVTVVLLLGLTFFIRYPEIVNAKLKFTTEESPKSVVSKTNGNIVKILVKDESWVERGKILAYLESTADHKQVLKVLDTINKFRSEIFKTNNLDQIISPNNLNLGELQSSYQNFYLAYLNFSALKKEGILKKRRELLSEEISNIDRQKSYIEDGYNLQKRELELAEKEYNNYKILAEKKIISPMELQQKEAILLSKRQSIPQTQNNIMANRGYMLTKNRELSEIDNEMSEEVKKFTQSLNSLISEGENWKKQYILTSPISGKLIYNSFLQENQRVRSGDEVFYIIPNNDDYYGEMYIPQSNSSKVKRGQEVLVKVQGYPYLEYGYIKGRISYLSDIPLGDSVFFSKVTLSNLPKNSLIKLKPGIYGDAEIITENLSVFKRIWLNVAKSMKY
ncbi:MAG: hypothetical protein K0S24_2439 [Sphingobacterium sp.]|jgi:HlyD family secretion protein|nr:hypothetical protein [Sphingobacterium sp.]